MERADRSQIPRGYSKLNPPTRHLRVFDHVNVSAKSTKALTPCISTLPDGTQRVFRKTNSKSVKSEPIAKSVTIHRRRAPKYDLGTILIRAESLGLDTYAVRDEYRNRIDNGYSRDTIVNIETNATFRGSDS